jgi:hypothetical protein
MTRQNRLRAIRVKVQYLLGIIAAECVGRFTLGAVICSTTLDALAILPIHYSASLLLLRQAIEKEPHSGCMRASERAPLLHFPASPFGFVCCVMEIPVVSYPAALALTHSAEVNEFGRCRSRPQQQRVQVNKPKMAKLLFFHPLRDKSGRPLALNKRDKSAAV